MENGDTASLSWFPKSCPPQWRPSEKEVGHSIPNLIFQALFGPAEAIYGRRGFRIPGLTPHSVSGLKKAAGVDLGIASDIWHHRV